MSRGVRPLAGFSLALLLLPLAAGSAGTRGSTTGESSVVREMVFATLAADGALRSTRVSQLLHVDTGDGTSTTMTVSDMSADDPRVPPIEVRARYALDGDDVTAEEIKGKSGTVRVELEIVNVSGESKTLTHPGVTAPSRSHSTRVFVPIEYAVVAEFPGETWRRVSAEGARFRTNDRGDEIVEHLGVLYPPLGSERATVVFEATGSRITLPRIEITASQWVAPGSEDGLSTQLASLKGLHSGLGGINANLEQVYEGTLDMVDGLEQMLSGVGQRDETSGEPVVSLDSQGDPDSILAALGFIRSAMRDKLLAGVGVRDPSTGLPVVSLGADGQPTTVLGALGFVEAAVRAQILPSIGSRDPATGRAVKEVDQKGRSETLLWGLQSSKDTYDQTLIPGIDEVIAGVDQMIRSIQSLDPNNPGLVEGLGALNDGLGALAAKIHTLDGADPGIVEGLQLVLGGLGQLVAKIHTLDPAEPGLVEGLHQVAGGLGLLIVQLDNTAPGGFRQGLSQIRDGALFGQATTTDPDSAAIFAGLAAGADQLLAGLGQRNPDGTPQIVFDADGNPATVIAALGLIQGAVATQILPALGHRDPVTGHPVVTLDGDGQPTTIVGALGYLQGAIGQQILPGIGQRDGVTGRPVIVLDGTGQPTTVIGALGFMQNVVMQQILPGIGQRSDSQPTTLLGALNAIRHSALTNPEFAKPQAGLGGLVPKDYYTDCPACWDPTHPLFDPRTADPRYQPSFREAFVLFSEGLEAGLRQLNSLNMTDPGLVEGLTLVADGLGALSAKLHTFDPNDPGLVDGLGQVTDGLTALIGKVHTMDDADPGLVDGLRLLRSGAQQVGQGLFATNELGLRTVRGTVGEAGDKVAAEIAQLEEAARLADRSFLAADAEAFTTYVLEIPAQSTATRDTAMRVAVVTLAALALSLLGRRPGWFGP